MCPKTCSLAEIYLCVMLWKKMGEKSSGFAPFVLHLYGDEVGCTAEQ